MICLFYFGRWLFALLLVTDCVWILFDDLWLFRVITCLVVICCGDYLLLVICCCWFVVCSDWWVRWGYCYLLVRNVVFCLLGVVCLFTLALDLLMVVIFVVCLIGIKLLFGLLVRFACVDCCCWFVLLFKIWGFVCCCGVIFCWLIWLGFVVVIVCCFIFSCLLWLVFVCFRFRFDVCLFYWIWMLLWLVLWRLVVLNCLGLCMIWGWYKTELLFCLIALPRGVGLFFGCVWFISWWVIWRFWIVDVWFVCWLLFLCLFVIDLVGFMVCWFLFELCLRW